jgi:hypothetical protein
MRCEIKPIKKLKAFTLMELAIGMLLASITVAAGFALYLNFIKTVKKHTDDGNKVKELQALYFTLENDIKNAAMISKAENGFVLQDKKTEKIIYYHLEDTLLLREIPDVASDTFKLHTEEIVFDAVNTEMNDPLIRHFSIRLNWNKNEVIYHWKKNYSPVESINQYITQEHGY